jgi:hypothetical protein
MAATRSRKTSAVSDSELELKIGSLLNATVNTLSKTGTAGSGTPRFFPNGINHIAISLEYGGAKASITVSGDANAGAALRATFLAESCREALRFTSDDLEVGDKVPNKSEADASGAIKKKITRKDPEFKNLVENKNANIVYKNEEGTGADRMMSKKLSDKLDALATLVVNEWTGVKLRVTEAWDEDEEHAGQSLHYEGRAADLTTSDIDAKKLGRLGRLAVDAEFDWVWYENAQHVHVSVKA